MTTDDTTKRAALKMLAAGEITIAEAAELAAVSRQLARYWALQAGLDVAETRRKWIARAWRQARRGD